MQEIKADASDGSVQGIAVNNRNPIVAVQEAPAASDDPGQGASTSAPLTTPPAGQQDHWEMVDDGKTPYVKRGPGRPPKAATAEAAADKIVRLALDKLLPHPLNEKLFGATSPQEINELAESIREVGQQSPLVVTTDLEKVGFYALLSGHKRAEAMRSLDWKEAKCQVIDVKDADERLVRLLEANRQHVPTTEQNLRIGEVYFELETKKAKARQVAGAKSAKKSGEVVETLPQPAAPLAKGGDDTAGKARDLAAAKVGMSGVSVEKGRKVLRAMEKAQQDGNKESAAKLIELLNEKGIDPSYEHAKVLHLIEQATKGNGIGGKAKRDATRVNGVDKPQEPVSLAVKPAVHDTDPVVAVANAGTDKFNAGVEGVDDTPTVAGGCEAPPTMEVADDDPPVIGIIAASTRLFDRLEALEVADLTINQKGNLYRALELVANWLADHDEMLQGPRKG